MSPLAAAGLAILAGEAARDAYRADLPDVPLDPSDILDARGRDVRVAAR